MVVLVYLYNTTCCRCNGDTLSGDFVPVMYGKGSGRGGVRGRVTVRYGA